MLNILLSSQRKEPREFSVEQKHLHLILLHKLRGLGFHVFGNLGSLGVFIFKILFIKHYFYWPLLSSCFPIFVVILSSSVSVSCCRSENNSSFWLTSLTLGDCLLVDQSPSTFSESQLLPGLAKTDLEASARSAVKIILQLTKCHCLRWLHIVFWRARHGHENGVSAC